MLATDDQVVIPNILKAYGVQYDTVVLPGTLPDLEVTANSVGAYSAVVTSAQLSGAFSPFTDAQASTLTSYLAKYNVRLVKINDIPDASTGVSGGAGTATVRKISFTDAGVTIANNGGLRPSLLLETTGLFYHPGVLTNAAQATPIMVFDDQTVAAAIIKQTSYTQLSMYIPFGYWSFNSVMLNHVWFTWATRGLYQGYRRISFTTQIDDLFLTTDTDSMPNGFRINEKDMVLIEQWQADMNKRMNPGSKYVIDFVFNGDGVLDYTSREYYRINGLNSSNIFSVRRPIGDLYTSADADFIKPLGTGAEVVCIFQVFFLFKDD
jgi:hypothetical protein